MSKFQIPKMKVAAAALGAVAVVGAGVGVAATATGDPTNPAQPTVSRNASGQSFGSGEAVTSDAQLPDLVQAYATNGKVGYIKKSDLLSPQRTLKEVQALPKKVVPAAPGQESSAPQTVLQAPPRTVPVYDKDGKTVIGQFKFGN